MLHSTDSHATLDRITQIPVNRLVLMGVRVPVEGVVRVARNRQQLRLALVASALPGSGSRLVEASLVTTAPRRVQQPSPYITMFAMPTRNVPISRPMRKHYGVRYDKMVTVSR